MHIVKGHKMSALDDAIKHNARCLKNWIRLRGCSCESQNAVREMMNLRSENERLKEEIKKSDNAIYASIDRISRADDVIRAAEFAQLNNLYIKTFHLLEECEENLKSMVEQYCRYNEDKNVFGHDFMSAGECTFEYLVARDLAEYTENGVDIRMPKSPEVRKDTK